MRALSHHYQDAIGLVVEHGSGEHRACAFVRPSSPPENVRPLFSSTTLILGIQPPIGSESEPACQGRTFPCLKLMPHDSQSMPILSHVAFVTMSVCNGISYRRLGILVVAGEYPLAPVLPIFVCVPQNRSGAQRCGVSKRFSDDVPTNPRIPRKVVAIACQFSSLHAFHPLSNVCSPS